jgi:hypothetical protein
MRDVTGLKILHNRLLLQLFKISSSYKIKSMKRKYIFTISLTMSILYGCHGQNQQNTEQQKLIMDI